jgi:hypothetical protein
LKTSTTKPKLYKAINDLDERVFIISKIKEIITPPAHTSLPPQLRGTEGELSEIAIIVR